MASSSQPDTATPTNPSGAGVAAESIILPRVTIQFCTQCKWMLRAAYYAQELLSTFSTALGEVSLQPSTSGTFLVHLYYSDPTTSSSNSLPSKHLIWDRKAQGGFPETKELKRLIRDIIQPNRDLGHVDRHSKQPTATGTSSESSVKAPAKTPSQDETPNPNSPNPDSDQVKPFDTETVMAGVPIPRAYSKLQEQQVQEGQGGEEEKGSEVPRKDVENEAKYMGIPKGDEKENGNQSESGACKPGDDCWEG